MDRKQLEWNHIPLPPKDDDVIKDMVLTESEVQQAVERAVTFACFYRCTLDGKMVVKNKKGVTLVLIDCESKDTKSEIYLKDTTLWLVSTAPEFSGKVRADVQGEMSLCYLYPITEIHIVDCVFKCKTWSIPAGITLVTIRSSHVECDFVFSSGDPGTNELRILDRTTTFTGRVLNGRLTRQE